jgi:hypothetical protein
MNAKLARRSIVPILVPVKAPARVIVKLIQETNPHGLDAELVPTDRMLERWAVSQGGDEYMTGWDEAPVRSRATPLPDDIAIVVDQTILHSTVQARDFVHRWYMRPGESVTVLAKALGLHRDTVHMRWRSTLWYMRRRFLEMNLDV